MRAELREPARRICHGRLDLRVDALGISKPRRVRDPHVSDAIVEPDTEVGYRGRPGVDIAGVWCGDDGESHRRVGNGSRETADMRKRPERRGWPRRHACARRLDAVAAGECGGDADRSTAVRSDLDSAHAENDGGRGTAGGAAGRFARIPWIARYSSQWTIGHALPAELGHRGLAENDCALFAQPRN